MTLNVFVCGLCLVALIGKEMNCDDAAMLNGTYGVETYIGDWLPWDIAFNESCVADGCPALNNLSFCPSDLGINALRDITKTISQCMSGPICGIVIDPRPVKYLVLSMDQFLPGSGVKGVLTTPPGAGVFSNASTIHLETSSESQHLPLELTMVIPNIRIHGNYRLDFRFKTGLGLDLAANLTHATYDITVKFISNIIVNQTGPNVDFTFLNPIIKSAPNLCGIDLPSGFPSILALYTESVQMIYDKSILATSIGRFMGKLYKSAIQVTLNNCKSSNVRL